jgi:transcriptional regulator NrdR family protein
MDCPNCKGKTRVELTHSYPNGTYRKRYCPKCGHEFPTKEVVIVLIEIDPRPDLDKSI